MHDFETATSAVAGLVAGIDDTQLAARTPCEKYALADLLDHVDALAGAFAGAARKEELPDVPPPLGDGANLPPDWRTRIPQRLADLAGAWRDPSAWSGDTAAGGMAMDAQTAASVAINEVVVHGWDIAASTGQAFAVDDETVAAARAFVEQFSGPGSEEMRGDAFGPVVQAPAGASALEQLVALNGRDPRWRARA